MSTRSDRMADALFKAISDEVAEPFRVQMRELTKQLEQLRDTTTHIFIWADGNISLSQNHLPKGPLTAR